MLTFTAASFLVDIGVEHILVLIPALFLVGFFFSQLGVLVGVRAEQFDDVSFAQTFVLQPLIFLGGVFYSASLLEEPFESLTQFNPIYYMINLVRYGFLGYTEANVALSLRRPHGRHRRPVRREPAPVPDRVQTARVTDFLVSRKDIRETRIEESEPPALEPGQALLAVDSFGLTANNVTYAVFGDLMSYWDFFPRRGRLGARADVGFRRRGGERGRGSRRRARACYGYLPPSSHLVVTPSASTTRGFIDASPHRKELPGTYQRYSLTGVGPVLPRGHRGAADAAAAAVLHLVPDRRPAGRRGPDGEGARDHRQRLEQDGDRRGLPPRPARGRGPGGPHLAGQRGVRGGPRHLRPHGHLRRRRLARARSSDAGGHRRRRRRAPGGAHPFRRRPGVQHDGGRDPLGGDGRGGRGRAAGPAAGVFFAPDRVEKRSEDWGAARARRAGRRGLARLQRLGRTAGSRWSGAAGSRRCRAPICRCSRATWRPTRPT